MARHLAAAQPPPQPSAAEWRAAMGAFPTGVTVVTSWDGATPVGSTINAFCSVSLEPPMLLICLDLNNPIRPAVEASGVFGVNFLGEENGQAAARHFATDPESDRFAAYGYRAAPGGAPWLEIAPAFVDCAVETVVAAGDHIVVVARGLRVEHTPEAQPLLYHRGRFPKLRSEP
jgi:3-hydroxy-9,10-secoandrosta-1,3,5(10)-triene-9,17-dione monooxygenase reductase component